MDVALLKLRTGHLRLKTIRKELYYYFGHLLEEEQQEQLLVASFIKKNDRVLEIGANRGRCSCIIAKLLRDPKSQLVVFECNPNVIPELTLRSVLIGGEFTVEPFALSDKLLFLGSNGSDLLHSKGLGIRVYDTYEEGRIPIAVMPYSEFTQKYLTDSHFTTLVIDCEGAFKDIIEQCPNILKGVKTIIIENDCVNLEQYSAYTSFFLAEGFRRILALRGKSESLPFPFHEVYIR